MTDLTKEQLPAAWVASPFGPGVVAGRIAVRELRELGLIDEDVPDHFLVVRVLGAVARAWEAELETASPERLEALREAVDYDGITLLGDPRVDLAAPAWSCDPHLDAARWAELNEAARARFHAAYRAAVAELFRTEAAA